MKDSQKTIQKPEEIISSTTLNILLIFQEIIYLCLHKSKHSHWLIFFKCLDNSPLAVAVSDVI